MIYVFTLGSFLAIVNRAAINIGGMFKWEGSCIKLWLIHVDVWEKPTEFYKAIILQLKNKFKTKKKVVVAPALLFQYTKANKFYTSIPTEEAR